jgi:hypothetical protein
LGFYFSATFFTEYEMGQYGNLGDKISVPREVSMPILVCNSGSSSLKFSLFEAADERLLAEGGSDWSTTPTRLVVRFTGQPEVCEMLISPCWP